MSKKKLTNILILGASGMLGSALMKHFIQKKEFNVYGTVRSKTSVENCSDLFRSSSLYNIDVELEKDIDNAFLKARPDIVINCIGLVKQLSESNDPLSVLPINSLLPHKLSKMCASNNARLIHFSTDCVFSGKKGMYIESDSPDAIDLYGLSKYIGEVGDKHCITLRTSIIGHELNGNRSLIDWFLKEKGSINGFKKAIFSGLPTKEIANILEKFVIPFSELHGLYHLSAEPINKYKLLSMVANTYSKKIDIIPDDEYQIDRSLNSQRFREITGYEPPEWKELINRMYESK
jgi:dTDP-4-dehydrorhamnose reductase